MRLGSHVREGQPCSAAAWRMPAKRAHSRSAGGLGRVTAAAVSRCRISHAFCHARSVPGRARIRHGDDISTVCAVIRFPPRSQGGAGEFVGTVSDASHTGALRDRAEFDRTSLAIRRQSDSPVAPGPCRAGRGRTLHSRHGLRWTSEIRRAGSPIRNEPRAIRVTRRSDGSKT